MAVAVRNGILAAAAEAVESPGAMVLVALQYAHWKAKSNAASRGYRELHTYGR
jgi:hypothetical protein